MTEQTGYWQRRLTRRRALKGTALGGAGLVGVAFIGCGKEERPAATAPSAPAQPKRGGTLAANSPFSDTPHLDHHQTASYRLLEDLGVYSRLLRLKLEEGVFPNETVTEGDLAERWEQPDPQTLIFHLHRGVKWHNIPPVNGRELKAQDVIFSFNRQIALRINAAVLEPVARITATDDSTLRFELTRPEADFLLMLADFRSVVLAPEAVELKGDIKEGPVIGTGPWVFQEWQPNQVMRMTRNPNYFRSGLPYADGLTIFRLTDPQTEQAAFKTGQIQVLDRVNRQIVQLVRGNVPNLQVVDAKLLGGGSGVRVWLHTERTPTSDIRVRQAISKALDRNAYIQSIKFGSAWLTPGVLMPSLDSYLPEAEVKKLLGEDAAEAKRLLAAAGMDAANWHPTVKSLQPPQEYKDATELFAAQLKSSLGIAVSGIIPVDVVRVLGEVFGRGEFEIALSGQEPQSTTSIHLRRWYKTGGDVNGGKLSDRQLDDMIERQASMVTDPEGRKRLLLDIQRRIIELAAIIPLYGNTEEAAIWPSLKNYFNSRGRDYARWEKAWLDI